MKTLYNVRRNNLRALIGEGKRFALAADLATALKFTPTYLSQLIGPKPRRRITETSARNFEKKLRLEQGSLDVAG
jgi:hypothetical protein